MSYKGIVATLPADPSLAQSAEAVHPIVFFDGVCGLCDGFVSWLMRRDKAGKLRFAPLQGSTARARIGELTGEPERWSIILLDEDGTHERSEAVLRILSHLGGIWRVGACLRILPRGFRDFFYRAIAKRRYRWFEKRTVCRMPTAADLGRMLD